jgi:hypothetical protein
MYTNHPDNNPLFQYLLFIVGLPYVIPYSGWIYLGIVLFNMNKLPWWVVTPVVIWSIICSRAVPESQSLIRTDIAAQGGVVTSKEQLGMMGLSILQYPTFIAALYVLFG